MTHESISSEGSSAKKHSLILSRFPEKKKMQYFVDPPPFLWCSTFREATAVTLDGGVGSEWGWGGVDLLSNSFAGADHFKQGYCIERSSE